MIKYLLFDWGDTIMRDDLTKAGPMVYWEKVEWIPHLRDPLHHILATKYQCVVASNSGESDTALMVKALSRIHAEEYFYDFYTSSDIGYEKPHPAFFKYILLKLNAEAGECIMVGNNYKKDIEGAKSVGIRTIWFNEGGQSNEKAVAADVIIESMMELVKAINSIETQILLK